MGVHLFHLSKELTLSGLDVGRRLSYSNCTSNGTRILFAAVIILPIKCLILRILGQNAFTKGLLSLEIDIQRYKRKLNRILHRMLQQTLCMLSLFPQRFYPDGIMQDHHHSTFHFLAEEQPHQVHEDHPQGFRLGLLQDGGFRLPEYRVLG